MKRQSRRKLNFSGHGTCEICKLEEILVQHHIRGRKISNFNVPTNLANICSNCHTKVHHGIIVIENKHLTLDGYQLIWHRYDEPSVTGNDASVHLLVD